VPSVSCRRDGQSLASGAGVGDTLKELAGLPGGKPLGAGRCGRLCRLRRRSLSGCGSGEDFEGDRVLRVWEGRRRNERRFW